MSPHLHQASINFSFDPNSQFDLDTGKPKLLLDLPIPPLLTLWRALLGVIWWPFEVLRMYSVQVLT